nr:hypothetical protein [uncultured Pseudomonas sp.]
MKKLVWNALALSVALGSVLGSGAAQAWTLEEASAPYKGTEIKAIFLDRPGYAAAIKLLPQFEKKNRDQGQLRNHPLRKQPRAPGVEFHLRRATRRGPD